MSLSSTVMLYTKTAKPKVSPQAIKGNTLYDSNICLLPFFFIPISIQVRIVTHSKLYRAGFFIYFLYHGKI